MGIDSRRKEGSSSRRHKYNVISRSKRGRSLSSSSSSSDNESSGYARTISTKVCPKRETSRSFSRHESKRRRSREKLGRYVDGSESKQNNNTTTTTTTTTTVLSKPGSRKDPPHERNGSSQHSEHEKGKGFPSTHRKPKVNEHCNDKLPVDRGERKKRNQQTAEPVKQLTAEQEALEKQKKLRLERFKALAASKLTNNLVNENEMKSSHGDHKKTDNDNEVLHGSNNNNNTTTTRSNNSSNNTSNIKKNNNGDDEKKKETPDVLEIFMDNLEKDLLKTEKTSGISRTDDTMDFHPSPPMSISLEEIQGWAVHKHKFATLETASPAKPETKVPNTQDNTKNHSYDNNPSYDNNDNNPEKKGPPHNHDHDHEENNGRIFSDSEGEDEVALRNRQESYLDLVKKVGNKKELQKVDHSKIKYADFRKNLYVQVREITDMKDHEVESFRSTHGDIKVRGKRCPRPIHSFYQCGLSDPILKVIEKRGYETPFPVQMQCIPALMAGRDVIGIAETGSGKTLAYCLPLLRHILDQPPLKPNDGPIALVMAPTRELTVQIFQEVRKFARVVDLHVVAVYGGTGIGDQLGQLKRGCEIVVATPGRLIDVLTLSGGKVTNLQRVTFLVLDEADRMFDMGFEPQINAIAGCVRPSRQTCMFSATFPTHIENLARQILQKPLEVTIGERGRAAARVTQYVEVREPEEKLLRLLQLLGEWHEHGSIIIFVTKQSDADELFAELLKYGYQCGVLHGGQDQTDREFTIQDFKDGARTILIATSVAARGLDVKSVVLVINYKVPDHLEDYVHRVGRTGRAGKLGVAYTFISESEMDRAEDLVRALRNSHCEVPTRLQRLADQHRVQCNLGLKTKGKSHGFGGKGFKFVPSELSRQQSEKEAAKLDLGMIQDADVEDELSPAAGEHQDNNNNNNSLIYNINNNNMSNSTKKTTIETLTASIAKVQAITGNINAAHVSEDARLVAQRAKALASIMRKPTLEIIRLSPEEQLKQASEMAEKATADIVDPLEREKERAEALKTFKKAIEQRENSRQDHTIRAALASAQAMARAIDHVPTGNSALVPGLSSAAYVCPSTGNYIDELDINDYPQQARYKISHKDVLAQISEDTGCGCYIKGQYVSPDRTAPPIFGKRLYVEIIGSTPVSVQRARHEIKMMMESIGLKQLAVASGAKAPPGRYQVI